VSAVIIIIIMLPNQAIASTPSLSECCEAEDDFLALNSLTSLKNVDLRYDEVLLEVHTASVWSQLSQLRSLLVTSAEPSGQIDDGAGFQRVMRGVAAATGLTTLQLDFGVGVAAWGIRPKLFGYLTGLQQLQELHVYAVEPRHFDDESDAADVMQVTALTGLTQLDVSFWHVGDVAAVKLACHLPELRILKLCHCCMESRAVLPAIGRLQHLQHLDLQGNAFGCDKCLQLLTQLRALTCLELVSRDGDKPTQQQLDAFWAAVRGQQQGQRQGHPPQ
jgi:hypothetical protein